MTGLPESVTLPPRPKPGTEVQVRIILSRPAPLLAPPVHHTQGAKTVPGPVLTEPER